MRQRPPSKTLAAALLGFALAAGAPAPVVAGAQPEVSGERSPSAAAVWACLAPGPTCDPAQAGADVAPTSFAALSAAPAAAVAASSAAADASGERFGLPAVVLATLGVVSFNAFRRAGQRPLRPTRPSS